MKESKNVVFLVQHVRETSSCNEDVKVIGVYSAKSKAEQAIKRLKTKPGFSEFPDGFHIDDYVLDVDHWAEGFAAV